MSKQHVLERTARKHSQKSTAKSNPVLLISNEDINSIDTRIAKLILTLDKLLKEVKPYPKMVGDYIWAVCSSLPGWIASNYLVISMVFLVLVFSLLLPDISQKIRKNNELKAMKNFVNLMQDEVKRAEVACLTANEEMCNLHCALTDQGTETTGGSRSLSVTTSRRLHATRSDPGRVGKEVGFFSRLHDLNSVSSKKEITIMSIVYTDLFDSQEKLDVTKLDIVTDLK